MVTDLVSDQWPIVHTDLLLVGEDTVICDQEEGSVDPCPSYNWIQDTPSTGHTLYCKLQAALLHILQSGI